MKKLVILSLLAVPAAVWAQNDRPELIGLPGIGEVKREAIAPEAEEAGEPAPRPDAGRILSEFSSSLRLSSKQEERITAAVNKKASEFDKLMKEYEKSSAEERKWRYKMNDSRHAMAKLHRELPDTMREYLDDEQRQEFDAMLVERNKPAPKPETPAVEQAQPQAPAEEQLKPARKKRLMRRRKPRLPVDGAAVPAGVPAGAEKAAVPAEEEAGQVMVDKDAAAAQPAKKRRVKRRAVAAPAMPEASPSAAPAAPAAPAGPAGAQPTGKDAAADEGASYP